MCRKEDYNIVKSQLDAAGQLYSDFIKQNTGITVKCTLDLSNEFLPPGPEKGSRAVSCAGGIVLSARNGQIVCKNTLDSRLELCFEHMIPAVRGILFGVRSKAVAAVAAPTVHGH